MAKDDRKTQSRLTDNPPSQWSSWAALVRLPNMFTVIADTSAAFLFVLGSSGWLDLADTSSQDSTTRFTVWTVWIAAIASVISLYWGGMILNDVFDIRKDARSGAARPLTRRHIPLKTARRAGWIILLAAIWPTLLIGTMVPPTATRWCPAWVAIVLTGLIVAYDGPLKRTPLAPVLMGLCRGMSFLLGAASGCAALGVDSFTKVHPAIWLFAIAMTLYITGITTFARREEIGKSTFHLPLGLLLITAGAILLAFAPRIGISLRPNFPRFWHVDPMRTFPMAMGFMLMPTLWRGYLAMRAPSTEMIGSTIRSGLLAIIPIAAAITVISVGAEIGIFVFALVVPSLYLARRFRVT